MKKLVSSFVFFFALTALFAQNIDPLVIGKWSGNVAGVPMELELKSDGSGLLGPLQFTYSTQNSTIVMTADGSSDQFNYKVAGDQLTLINDNLPEGAVFKRNQTAVTENAVQTPEVKSTTSTLTGTWSGGGETMIFNTNGQGILNGVPFQYTATSSALTITGSTGTVQLQYSIAGNQLTLTGNGTTATLTKGTNNNQTQSGGTGTIDQSIVGKWCYTSSLTNPNASSSYSRCVVINANGTYEYYGESSISGYGGDMYGGSSSQVSDKGTWKLNGNQLVVQSQKEGLKTYTFEKRNHPKNNDPMIIIGGEPFVTFYQRAPW